MHIVREKQTFPLSSIKLIGKSSGKTPISKRDALDG
jgi:hypothetical protein